MTQRLRTSQITVAVASDMREEIETYIQAHEEMDWNDVINEALHYWYGLMPRKALANSRLGLSSPEELEARADWRHLRGAHRCHLGRSYTPRGEA